MIGQQASVHTTIVFYLLYFSDFQYITLLCPWPSTSPGALSLDPLGAVPKTPVIGSHSPRSPWSAPPFWQILDPPLHAYTFKKCNYSVKSQIFSSWLLLFLSVKREGQVCHKHVSRNWVTTAVTDLRYVWDCELDRGRSTSWSWSACRRSDGGFHRRNSTVRSLHGEQHDSHTSVAMFRFYLQLDSIR